MSFIGVGTTLAYGDSASPEVFTSVGKVANIGGPEIAKDEIEDTTLDSPNNFKEFLSGLKDGGQVTFTVHYTPATANQEQIITDVNADSSTARKNWRMTWVTPSPNIAVDFLAEVFSITFNTEPNAPVTMDVTLRVSGAVTIA